MLTVRALPTPAQEFAARQSMCTSISANILEARTSAAFATGPALPRSAHTVTFRCTSPLSAAHTPAAVAAIVITIAVSLMFVPSASAGGSGNEDPTGCDNFLVRNTHGSPGAGGSHCLIKGLERWGPSSSGPPDAGGVWRITPDRPPLHAE